MEFGLEQLFDSITYNLSIPDPEPTINDLWSQWQDRCDELGLDAYLDTTEVKKQFRKNMLAELNPLSLAQALGRSLHSPQREKKREKDRAFYIWVKEQVIQNQRSYINDNKFEIRNSSPSRRKTNDQPFKTFQAHKDDRSKREKHPAPRDKTSPTNFQSRKKLHVSSVARLTICSATALTLRIIKKLFDEFKKSLPKKTSGT